MLIIEGPDGTGKSTLIERLNREYSLPIKSGEGPPKDIEDFRNRVDRYLRLESITLYDRHPVISGPIYASARGVKPGLTKSQLIDFYSRPKLVLITHPKNASVFTHQAKAYDTEDHLRLVNEHSEKIASLYLSLSKMPDYHLIDPLGPWTLISSLVEDFIRRKKS